MITWLTGPSNSGQRTLYDLSKYAEDECKPRGGRLRGFEKFEPDGSQKWPKVSKNCSNFTKIVFKYS